MTCRRYCRKDKNFLVNFRCRGRTPSVAYGASSPKGAPFGDAENFAATEAVPLGKVAKPQALTEGVVSETASFHFSLKLYRHAKGPISEGAVAVGDWGSSPTEKGCLPDGRQPFSEENKENTRPKGQSEYQNILSSL